MIEEKKSGAARNQPATRDEFWTDARVLSFLEMIPPEGISADYHILLKAYRGMLPDTFARFVAFFSEHNRDVNARGADGSTMLDHVSQHRKSGEYAQILVAAGGIKTH